MHCRNLHEIHARVGNVFKLLIVEVGFLVQNRVVHIFYGLAEERRRPYYWRLIETFSDFLWKRWRQYNFTWEKHITQHAKGPHVAAVVVIAVEHFWSSVVAGANLLSEALVRREVLWQAEIDQDEWRVRVVIFEQKVLQFQISVHNAFLQIYDMNLFHECYFAWSGEDLYRARVDSSQRWACLS